MNILITQHRLIGRGGTEMYVLDLARMLLKLNHRVVVYSPQIGELAEDFLEATIPVVDDLSRTQIQPDIIHGHHGIEMLSAMMHFPYTPAVYVLHDWGWAIDKPPVLDRIRRFIAVDETCQERLLYREGIAPERTMVLQNAVDLNRFRQRGELPESPTRALVFSNYVDRESVEPIVAACASMGIEVNVVGANVGAFCKKPELLLRKQDIVFAKARCAREALATGCAVIVSDSQGVGEMVTSANVKKFARFNFGRRLLQHDCTFELIRGELLRYNSTDAAKVTQYVRKNFRLEELASRLLMQYEQAIQEYGSQVVRNMAREYAQIADYLKRWSTELAAQHLLPESASHDPLAGDIRRAA